jgi:signal transduction histidine kinase
MFHSATLKLTGWYLSILIIISLLFSTVIYNVASSEVSSRLTKFPNNPQIVRIFDHTQLDVIRHAQLEESRHSLLMSLIVSNAFIWMTGGIGSYYLAKRSLKPIERAMEAQARFTSDASHELRTPLASMKTEIEVALRDPALTKAEMRELLDSNLEEVNKLSSLSYNLLKMSRLEHDSIEHVPVDLADALHAVIGRFASAKHRLQLPEELPHTRVMANQANLEELLTIFIDNALKYSPADSTVRIGYIHSKAMSGFTFTNDGEGIEPTILPHIFDRFFQADSSRTSGDSKGYGLGLSLAKKIVALHNGELTASSQVGGPTTFTLELRNYSK